MAVAALPPPPLAPQHHWQARGRGRGRLGRQGCCSCPRRFRCINVVALYDGGLKRPRPLWQRHAVWMVAVAAWSNSYEVRNAALAMLFCLGYMQLIPSLVSVGRAMLARCVVQHSKISLPLAVGSSSRRRAWRWVVPRRAQHSPCTPHARLLTTWPVPAEPKLI